MVTIFKPTDWEVDGLDADGEEHPPLSAFLQSIFPKCSFPLVHDPEHSYGFLHRLDIPSSGLVLGGTSFEGYFHLRLQLDTHRLKREYVVLCCGYAPAHLSEVSARVDVLPDPSQRRSINESGKPSRTFISVVLHMLGCIGQLEEGSHCVVSIRIFTGRRHQIRAHMRYVGYPSVADARYTARLALISSAQASVEVAALRQSGGNIVSASVLLSTQSGSHELRRSTPQHVTYH